MQFKKTILRLLIFLFPLSALTQSATLPQGSKHLHFLDRLEIMLRDNADLNFSGQKPYVRKTVVMAAQLADSLNKSAQHENGFRFSVADDYNLQSLLMNNSEWVTGDKTSFQSKKSVWNTFYKTKADLVSIDEKDFFLAVNPVVQQQQSVESGNDERIFLNSKGLTARGLVAGRVGFDFYLTDNQERPPLFVQRWEDNYRAVPGAGFYKTYNKTGYDYFDARGSVYFSAAKYFNFQFGYDKNYIGNGYRSLFLSDFGTNNLFFKINTKVWRFNYTNLFMELHPQFASNPGNVLLPKKYAAMHRLSLNVTKWLNVGVSEMIIFGRQNRFEFSYLNPVIFLRSIEQQNGSADNALIGLDAKVNIAHRGQLYAQLLLDEFAIKEIRSSKGWWGNKYALQLGGKYINAFSLKNFDLQGEMNIVRPFTYSHYNAIGNYTHYNQPLAHQLGSDFIEAIGIIWYQPLPRLSLQAKVIAFTQGVDTGGRNLGNNIFLVSGTRPFDYGYKIPSGSRSNGVNASLLASYEIKENLFLDGSIMSREVTASGRRDIASSTTLFTLGVRMNMFRREYDY